MASTQETMQLTLSIIKPDAVSKNHIGEIITRFEKKGLIPVAMRMFQLTEEEAGDFYDIHRERPFFKALVEFMSSGPVLVMVLQGVNAVAKAREIMGATNPKEAAAGTIRKDFATTIDANAIHGSDSEDNAIEEIAFFFDEEDLCPRS